MRMATNGYKMLEGMDSTIKAKFWESKLRTITDIANQILEIKPPA